MVTVSVTIDNDEANHPAPTLFSTIRDRLDRISYSLRSAIKFRRSRKSSRSPDRNENPSQDKKVDSSKESQSTSPIFKYIVDTSLPWYYRWLMVISLAMLYNVMFIIGRAVFWDLNNFLPPLWFTLDYTCDVIYVIDIFLRAHQGYLEQGLLVTDPQKLRKDYMIKKKWRTDLISVLPTDFIYCWWSPYDCHFQVPCAVIVRVNRVVKLPRLWDWFKRIEGDTNYPNAFRICKVLLAIVILIHWNACFYFAVSYAIGFSTDDWVYNIEGPENSTLAHQYIYSFYWSMLTLTTAGETPVPENDAEYLFVILDFLAGVLVFAAIVGNIGSMISDMNVARVDFQNRMDSVKQYMAFRKVGRELEERTIKWFTYTWAQCGALDEEKVLAALPDKLRGEISSKVHLDTLRKVTIFQDCETGLLEALVVKLHLQVFSPGDFICKKGDVGKELYIVKRGRLQVVSDDGVTVFVTLEPGSVFGEVSVLDIVGNKIGNRRTANVKSIGYSDLFCLAKDDLWDALADYPEAITKLTERGCEMLRKNNLLDEEAFAKSNEAQESAEETVFRLAQLVKELQSQFTRALMEFNASQTRLKRLMRSESRSEEDEEQPTRRHARRKQRSFEVKKKFATKILSHKKTL